MLNYQSDSLTNLIPALTKAQMKLEIAEKNKKAGSGAAGSRTYKYADWPTVVEASRKPLADNGLCVTQRLIENVDGSITLSTLLLHASGEFIDSRIRLPLAPNSPPQSIGSCITYFKRYAYSALIGVVADDEDDDGAAAEKFHREYQPKPAAPAPAKVIEKTSLSDREVAILEYELTDAPDLRSMIFEKYDIGALKDVPANAYEALVKKIREIKKAKQS